MKGVIGHPHAFIERETLPTLFAEAVDILNTRPLCSSSDDPNDFEALTPSHFLQQWQGLAIPPGVFEDSEISSRKQWKRGQVWLIISGLDGVPSLTTSKEEVAKT